MRIWWTRAARSRLSFRVRAIGSAVAISAVSLAGLPVLASATSTVNPPYTSGTWGYDVSWPNCSTKPSIGATVSFDIVGIGDGRPFTSSPCASQEYLTAKQGNITPSLYYNTGYSGAYGRDILSVCTTTKNLTGAASLGTFPAGLKGHALSQAEQAWEIGCSEAEYGFSHAAALGSASFWWADVETGNSWSTNTNLNQYAIDGMSYAMNVMNTNNVTDSVVGGGIYSSVGSWIKLTGSSSWAPTPAAATWVASGTCNTRSFAYSMPAVVQNPPASGVSGNVDVDEAC